MATERKLKYCPECGAYVELNYGRSLIHSAVTWRCHNRKCFMSKAFRPLDGWNEINPPNIRTRIMEVVRVVRWWWMGRTIYRDKGV